MGYTWKDEPELMAYAARLEHVTSGELAEARRGKWSSFNRSAAYSGKTGVGDLVEAYFGKEADNEQRPDIPELDIEIKTLPLLRYHDGSPRVKEPTSITAMNYHVIDGQSWDAAYVRHKIGRILWVPFMHDKDKRKVRFLRPFLWSPEPGDWPVFEADYDASRALIKEGRAHELSETIAKVLAPRRKGAKGQMTTQPHQHIQEKAKTRAWAFKPAYTRPIVAEHVVHRPLPKADLPVSIQSLDDVEPVMLDLLHKWQGMTIREIHEAQDRVKLNPRNLNGAAQFVRALVGQKARGESIELEKLGIRIRTVWARPSDCEPHEPTSFQKMVLQHFADEEWGESTLEDDIDRILFIPLWQEERPKAPPGQRVADQGGRVLGKAFLWAPGPLEWAGVEAEWKIYQEHVRDCNMGTYVEGKWQSNMPPGANTQYIHMRPHGQKGHGVDIDLDPCGNEVTKQCFWLNASWVRDILREHGGPRPNGA